MTTNRNYTNPESFYPLQTTTPNSGAFGAGTVPGSFLAGMMLPERMQDYRNVRDVSLESSKIGNKQAGANLTDFLAQQPSKNLLYNMQGMETRNKMALMPFQHQTNMENAKGDFRASKPNNELKVAQALAALPAHKAQAQLTQLITASTVLKGIPKASDGTFTLQMLKEKFGIDTSDWDVSWLDGIRNMDPQSLKDAAEMSRLQYTQAEESKRWSNRDATDLEEARIRAAGDKTSAAGVKEANMQRHSEDYVSQRVVEIRKTNPRISEKMAEAIARKEVAQMRLRDEFYTGGGRAQGSISATEGLFKLLEGEDSEVKTTAPDPKPGKETMTIPEVGEVEVISREGKRVRIYDPKSGKFGWWEE